MPGIFPRDASGEVRRRTPATSRRQLDDSDDEGAVGGTATIVSSTR